MGWPSLNTEPPSTKPMPAPGEDPLSPHIIVPDCCPHLYRPTIHDAELPGQDFSRIAHYPDPPPLMACLTEPMRLLSPFPPPCKRRVM